MFNVSTNSLSELLFEINHPYWKLLSSVGYLANQLKLNTDNKLITLNDYLVLSYFERTGSSQEFVEETDPMLMLKQQQPERNLHKPIR